MTIEHDLTCFSCGYDLRGLEVEGTCPECGAEIRISTPEYRVRIMQDACARIRTPLRLIFWGAIICILDFSINGFDVINDIIGAMMISVGTFRLAGIEVHERYRNVLTFVKIVALAQIVAAVLAYVHVPTNIALSLLQLVFGLVTLVAVIGFCVAMRWFAEAAVLPEAAKSWRTTTTLFVVIHVVPLGLLYLAGFIAMITGESFNIDLGAAGLLLFIVLVVPLIHLFVSTSRTVRAAENRMAGARRRDALGQDVGPA